METIQHCGIIAPVASYLCYHLSFKNGSYVAGKLNENIYIIVIYHRHHHSYIIYI